MKRILLHIISLVLFSVPLIIKGQLSTYVTDISLPTSIAFQGDSLYVCEYGSDLVSIYDCSGITPLLVDSITGLNGCAKIVFHNNFAYVAEYLDSKISKFDYTQTNPTITDVITGLNGPFSLAFKGDELFIAEMDGNTISKLDVSNSNPIITNVISGLNRPVEIAFNNDDLYICEYFSNKVSKIDVTLPIPVLTNVVTNVNSPIGLVFNGDNLYISENYLNKIIQINIADTIPIKSDIVSTSDPLRMAFYGLDLYITNYGVNRISKYYSPLLSAEKSHLDTDFILFPNPTKNYIQIIGNNVSKRYSIYNIYGSLINGGEISGDNKIVVQEFEPGIYVLFLDNGKSVKFIKE
ncbi:MAG: DNA-binding beta-propeller fold protein YncE [Flavobacteriales bacterium]|jgi:DNA-binding beta-propeller fold protein YncE